MKPIHSKTFSTAEFIPAKEKNAKNLLLVLHGRGDSKEGFKWFPKELRIPSMNYLLLNAPDDWEHDGDMGFSWYDHPPNQGPGVKRSRKLLFKLLRELNTVYKIPFSRIGFFGFSQGCLMSIDVGLRFPEKLLGIAALGGYVFFTKEYPKAFSKFAEKQNWFVAHGIMDRALSIRKTRPQIERLIKLGIPIDWREYPIGHTIDAGRELGDTRKFLKACIEDVSAKKS